MQATPTTTQATATIRPEHTTLAGSLVEGELPFVSTKLQLAAVLGVSPKHIENLTARGLLRPVRLGRCVRYRRDAVLRALAVMEETA
jgi:excisionase family DNA binding protein